MILPQYGQSEHLAALPADLGEYGATTPRGWSVELVTLTVTPDRHDGQWLWVQDSL